MLLSRHWLDKHLDLKGVRNKQITKALNDLGFEVTSTLDFKDLNDALVIGRIEKSSPIPDTRLTINKVKVGVDQYLSIVCGAPNVKRNHHVIVAQQGQKIASGVTINPRSIKGRVSEGMICALNEIGIANKNLTPSEQNRIYDLGKNREGKDLVGRSMRHLELDDFIWDLDITFNRSDALSAFQLTKELANYFKVPINWPTLPNVIALLKPKTEIKIAHDVKPHVISLVGKSFEIRNNRNKISIHHDLLLKKIGIPTTDNFFEDLANLNAWETGQPLIIIDRNKLLGNLSLQMANIKGQDLLVLASNGELVQIIGQPTHPNFAVDGNSKTLLVLALKVNENLMRRQSRALSPNPALQRYTRQLSLAIQEMGLKNYERFLATYGLIRAKSPLKIWVKSPIEHYQIITSLERINNFLGINLSPKELAQLLKNTDLLVKTKNNQLIISPNPVRTDLVGENEVIGEIARLYGYEKIPAVPLTVTLQPHHNKWNSNMEIRVQDYLNALGFFNVKTYSLINQTDAETWNIFDYEPPLKIMSPLSKMHTHYRPSLVPSFLNIAELNVANGHKDFKFWEVADVYSSANVHHRHLILGAGGKVIKDPLNHYSQPVNYSYIKGLVEAILDFYGIDLTQVTFEPLDNFNLVHPLASAAIKYKAKTLGYIIRFTSQFLAKQKLPLIYLAELNMDYLVKLGFKTVQTYKSPNKFQISKRALTFVLPSNVAFSDVIKQLTHHVHYLVNWSLVDHYQSEKMLKNQEQALTIDFSFNHPHHQLTESEINEQWTRILSNIRKTGLQVR